MKDTAATPRLMRIISRNILLNEVSLVIEMKKVKTYTIRLMLRNMIARERR